MMLTCPVLLQTADRLYLPDFTELDRTVLAVSQVYAKLLGPLRGVDLIKPVSISDRPQNVFPI